MHGVIGFVFVCLCEYVVHGTNTGGTIIVVVSLQSCVNATRYRVKKKVPNRGVASSYSLPGTCNAHLDAANNKYYCR